jgi:glutathione peroxidase
MLKYFIILLAAVQISFGNNNKENKNMNNIYDLTVLDMNGKEVKLSDYKGKVLMIVNVASKCGYTRQYSGLESIYEKYKSKGFEILAFPCNDFGAQEPGTNKEIQEFCTATFGVKFKLFDKIKVLGKNKSPLYERLINNSNTEQGDIKWNFEKFIISKDGEIIARFRSGAEPESKEVLSIIESELKK